MFKPILSLSACSTLTFRFMLPGLVLRLFCFVAFALPVRMRKVWSADVEASTTSGRASARESKVVASFFDGRRRLSGFDEDFFIFERRAECFIIRLSFLVDGNADVDDGKVEACRFGLMGAYGRLADNESLWVRDTILTMVR